MGPRDGSLDTPPEHPRPSSADDPAGDGKGAGPWAPDRIASYTGKLPDHFSLLAAFFGECHPESCASWGRPCTWGLILSALLMAWTFKNLKVISDVYFVPSTIALAKVLGMPSDVAGATLLAFGSSAPEFCTNVVATFFIVNECGIGDIIGSAIHNVLLVVGVSGIFATRSLNLWWYPLSRDCIFYLVAIVQLTLFLWDEYIQIWEASVMCLTYVAYCGWMLQNIPIYEGICGLLKKDPVVPEDADEEDDELEGAIYYDPVEVLWRHTMPDQERSPFTCFMCSLGNIAILSYLMVDSATRFGCITGIPTLFMGLVFLAAGTSIPDAFASMGAARRGEGDMAVSNALGSNIFDILLGLGFPWLIALLLGKPIVFLGVNRLLTWVMLLIVILFLFMGVVIISGWKLNQKMGLVLGGMYIGYVIFGLHQSYAGPAHH
jgi:K+-dependent Na+/Ca+ exchanger-like protein